MIEIPGVQTRKLDLRDLERKDRPWFESLEPEHEQFYREQGIQLACKIHGKVCGIQRFIYTWGLIVGADETGYEYRFCYPTIGDAAQALMLWMLNGGEEPEGYIKRKPEIEPEAKNGD